MDMFGMMEEMMGNVVSVAAGLCFTPAGSTSPSNGRLCLQERMTGAPNCQTFSSSTVISYSSSGAGAPKVYQQTSQTTTGPGGVRICPTELLRCSHLRLVSTLLFSPQIRETRQSLRDSESGLERLAIGHHIGARAHIVARSQNRRTGDREERQDFINLEESE